MIKQIAKRFLSLLLVFILILSLSPNIIPEAAAAELTVSGTLSVVPGDDMGELVSVSAEKSEDNGTGSVSISKNVITIAAKGISKTSGTCSDNPAKASTTTWTLQNTHGTAATLTYTFTKTTGDGSVSPTSGTATIQAGGTLSFQVTSAAPDTAAETKATLTLTGVTFAVAPCTTVFLEATNGTYSGSCSDGWQVTPGQSHEAQSNQYYQLTAVPAAGYSFSAWIDGNGTILSRSNPYQMSPADRSVTAKFIPTGAAIYYIKGNPATEYYYLDQAIAAAGSSGTVVVKENGKVLGSSGQTGFSVPRGVTLLVPYDAAATVITNNMKENVNGAYSNPPASTLFRRLILPSGSQISVESGGILCVCSQALNYSKGQVGPYGQLVLEQDSTITIKNGAYLYAYGYLSESTDQGAGTVTVQSGGTVYEDLMIMDYPGSATTANNLYNTEKIFPMRAYSLRNVEVPMTIHAGGTEYAFASIYGTSAGLHTVNVKIIGSSSSEAFQIRSGSLTKAYSNGRHYLTMNGDCALNDMTVSLSMTIQTASTSGLPLPSGFCIEAASGTVTINANLLLLEGTELTVDPGVTVNIASGKAVYVFDETDDAGTVNVKDYHGTAYTLVKSDCRIDVNGTVDVRGALYTTTNKANITSSEGTGRIRFSNSAGTATSVKYKSGSSAASTANLTAAQLHNGANRPSGEEEYTSTTGAVSGDLFGYSAALDQWLKNPITLTFDANGGEGSMPAQMIPKDTDSVLTANSYTRDGYSFLGWSTDASDETAMYSDEATVRFSADTTLYAIWENHASYTITWKNGDGTVLKTDTLSYGTTPEYSGDTPTKACDETGHYTFSGWDPAPSPVTGDAVYTAQFTVQAHAFTEEITTPASCTANGEKTLHCSCGYTDTQVIPMTGHDLVHHEAKAPTCTEIGWNTYDTCSRCDYSTCEELPALGHDWDEGVVTTEPTLTQEGVKTFTCRRCGETRTEAIDKLPAVDTAALEAAIAAAEAVVRNDYTEESLAALDEALEAAQAALADDKLTQEQADAAAAALINAIQALMPKDAVPMTVYVVDENNQAVLYYYAFHKDPVVEKAGWPGEGMTSIGQDRNGKNVYRIEIDTSRYDYVVFNNGAGWQTMDLPYTADAAALELDYIVYFLNSNEAVDGKYKAWPTTDVWKIESTKDATCTEAGEITLKSFVTGETKTEEGEPALGHDLIHHEGKAPTCTETGWNAYDTCSRCDYTTYAELPALGHDWSDWTVTTAATCVEKGVETRNCSRCNEAETRELDALGHDLVRHEAKAPTCMETGWNAYDTCSRCDYSTYEELPALGHKPGEPVKENEKAATCTEPGGYDNVVYCTVCQAELSREHVEIPALGHNPGEPVKENEKAATCTEPGGYDMVTYCTVCHEKLDSVHTEIPALGHDWGEWTETTAPTCTEKGIESRSCSRCDAAETREIPALGHKPGEPVKENEKAATCTEPGGYDNVVYCTVCQAELSREHVEIPALGHNPGEPVKENEKAVTCTEPGGYDMVTYCTVCHEKLDSVHTEIPALGHDWGEWTETTAPTCTEKGIETRKCSRCDAVETREIEALGHKPGEPVKENEKAATCTEAGGYDNVVYCTVCKEELSREHVEIPALGHKPGEPVKENEKAATCTETGGYDMVTYCTVCHEKLDSVHTEIPALGHDWGEWTETTAPTCTEKGIETRTCSRCDATETQEVEALGHKPGEPVKENETAPTCTEPGGYDMVTYCTVCNEKLDSVHTELSALGHDWDEPTYSWSEDNSSVTATRTCKLDETHTETETVQTTSEVTLEPTYKAEGELTYTATFTNEAFETQTKTVAIPKLGNPFVDVEEEDYFYEPVMWAFYSDPQITKGTDETHFSPDGTCTRAQVVTFLWRTKGCPAPETTENPFRDVGTNAYYYDAVLWAVENNITVGTSKMTFSPNQGCTRAQVVTFLWRTEKEPEPETTENPFADVAGSAYYYDAVLWAVEKGITLGTSNTTFSPNNTCTRGQIVTFLFRAFAEE